MFKSLADASTWESTEEKQSTDSRPTTSHSDDVDCELEEDYDIPQNRESLQTLVKNLSFIVQKLKNQIQKLDEEATKETNTPSQSDISRLTTSSTKKE
jgi:DNA-binding ferritin-like protein